MGLIEVKQLGGTCVNVGCVPKKVMWNAATVGEMIHDAKHFGFTVPEVSFNWLDLKQARDDYVTRLNGIYGRMLGNSKVEVISGLGSFSGPKSVSVNGEEYSADHILIAVGGKPSVPSLPGVEHCITSDGLNTDQAVVVLCKLTFSKYFTNK